MTSLRVLISVFTCCPPGSAGFTGGESHLGWSLLQQIARFHQLWALTQEADRATIEQALKDHGNAKPEIIGRPPRHGCGPAAFGCRRRGLQEPLSTVVEVHRDPNTGLLYLGDRLSKEIMSGAFL